MSPYSTVMLRRRIRTCLRYVLVFWLYGTMLYVRWTVTQDSSLMALLLLNLNLSLGTLLSSFFYSVSAAISCAETFDRYRWFHVRCVHPQLKHAAKKIYGTLCWVLLTYAELRIVPITGERNRTRHSHRLCVEVDLNLIIVQVCFYCRTFIHW